eukprot:1007865-Prymnesium_polylepis.1
MLLAVSLAAIALPGPPRAPRLPASPFPVSEQPTHITVWNITTSSFDERATLCDIEPRDCNGVLALSAVGIVAQRRPELATVNAADSTAPGPTGRGGTSSLGAWHLSLLPATLDWGLEHDAAAILQRFASDFSGYIMCESASGSGGPGSDNGSMHVAVGLAGVLQALVVTPSTVALAQSAGLKMALDARSLTLEDAFARYKANYSTSILFNQQHSNLEHTTDFSVYAKAFALYDSTLTMPLSQHALARLRPISMVIGWANEVDFVTSASRHGHQVLCSDFTTNVPVFSNFVPPQLPPPPPPRKCSASASDAGKHT